MPFVQGETRCAFCEHPLDTPVNVYQCRVCLGPGIYFHDDCVDHASRKCPECGYLATADDLVAPPPPPPPALELPEGEDESAVTYATLETDDGLSTATQTGNLGDLADVPAAEPDTGDLLDFLKAAPAPEAWTVTGYEHGGYVLQWTGTSGYFDPVEQFNVRFHVHGELRNGVLGWAFGGAWISGVDDVGVSINGTLQSATDRTRLTAVVQAHWPEIRHEIETTEQL
ncbi:MAG: hypothetical protein E6J41_08705 [Chloroflexi bacterium]|nr:MAG: hypothetical protein E6J41_08705 [Chloroflexota bacterium]